MSKPVARSKILNQPQRHADACRRKSPVPARFRMKSHSPKPAFEPFALRQKAANQRGKKGAEIDAHVKDRKAGIAAWIFFAVEAADHRADVRLQQAGADDD